MATYCDLHGSVKSHTMTKFEEKKHVERAATR